MKTNDEEAEKKKSWKVAKRDDGALERGGTRDHESTRTEERKNAETGRGARMRMQHASENQKNLVVNGGKGQANRINWLVRTCSLCEV